MKNNTTGHTSLPKGGKLENQFWLKATYWAAIAIFLFLSLQTKFCYYFYYIEQLQLFLLTREYFLEKICMPGGIADYVAGFIMQFYILPYAGAILTTILFLTGCILLQSILKKLSAGTESFVTASLPMLLQIPLFLDISYRLQETIAYLCMLVFFHLFLHLSSSRGQLVASILIPVLLFWLAGPVAILWVASVIIWVLLRLSVAKYLNLVCIPTLAAIAYLSFFESWKYSFWDCLIPDFHYENTHSHLSFPYYVYVAYLFSLFLFGLLGKKIRVRPKEVRIIIAFQITISAICIWGITDGQKDQLLLEKIEQDYYLRNREWQKIISTFQQRNYDLQTINILNLALAKEGRLDKELFKYPQRGGETLLSEWDEQLPGAIAQTELHYHIGNIGAAQKYAYEGYIISHKGNPRLLKQLVKTNLIFGFYPVAEKYITILEQTLFYKDWAQRQRKYLYDDQILESDKEYGSKRKAIRKNQDETVSLDFIHVLEYLAVNDPDNQLPLFYLTTYHLLNKDLITFNGLYEKYYHTEVWPRLTIRQQEAVVAWYEDEQDLWPKKGIGLKTEQRFIAYKNEMQRQKPYSDPKKNMANQFGDTYWYYLLFKE